MKQKGNIELTLQTIVGHANMAISNYNGTIFRITVGDIVRYSKIEPSDVLQRYSITAWELVIFGRA